MIIAKLHLLESPIMDNQIVVISVDRCLSHMYDTLHIYLRSSQIIYFYVSVSIGFYLPNGLGNGYG